MEELLASIRERSKMKKVEPKKAKSIPRHHEQSSQHDHDWSMASDRSFENSTFDNLLCDTTNSSALSEHKGGNMQLNGNKGLRRGVKKSFMESSSADADDLDSYMDEESRPMAHRNPQGGVPRKRKPLDVKKVSPHINIDNTTSKRKYVKSSKHSVNGDAKKDRRVKQSMDDAENENRLNRTGGEYANDHDVDVDIRWDSERSTSHSRAPLPLHHSHRHVHVTSTTPTPSQHRTRRNSHLLSSGSSIGIGSSMTPTLQNMALADIDSFRRPGEDSFSFGSPNGLFSPPTPFTRNNNFNSHRNNIHHNGTQGYSNQINGFPSSTPAMDSPGFGGFHMRGAGGTPLSEISGDISGLSPSLFSPSFGLGFPTPVVNKRAHQQHGRGSGGASGTTPHSNSMLSKYMMSENNHSSENIYETSHDESVINSAEGLYRVDNVHSSSATINGNGFGNFHPHQHQTQTLANEASYARHSSSHNEMHSSILGSMTPFSKEDALFVLAAASATKSCEMEIKLHYDNHSEEHHLESKVLFYDENESDGSPSSSREKHGGNDIGIAAGDVHKETPFPTVDSLSRIGILLNASHNTSCEDVTNGSTVMTLSPIHESCSGVDSDNDQTVSSVITPYLNARKRKNDSSKQISSTSGLLSSPHFGSTPCIDERLGGGWKRSSRRFEHASHDMYSNESTPCSANNESRDIR